jgi:hypothetical protein
LHFSDKGLAVSFQLLPQFASLGQSPSGLRLWGSVLFKVLFRVGWFRAAHIYAANVLPLPHPALT